MERKFYSNINSLNNINVQIICDGEEIYSGNVNEARDEIKAMRYYDIVLGSQTKVYVTKQEYQE